MKMIMKLKCLILALVLVACACYRASAANQSRKQIWKSYVLVDKLATPNLSTAPHERKAEPIEYVLVWRGNTGRTIICKASR